ncbi:type VII secretion protein EccE [Mycobacterium nebraskense]|uniref:type VII secretion protein EccE n=1 Tax=Mycobacterium nebraskense TaxID=244292 RepID=UPI0023EFFEDF|nr:type VII secretion protein EccE [Mycobacterium nebraskense]MBI2696649.1 type VII secretion protein EccE [Mycobacterium nebraskense]
MRSLRLRFSSMYALWVAALAPVCILLFLKTRYMWAGPTVVAVAVLLALVTFRGRRLFGWVAAFFAWLVRRRRPLLAPSEPVVGATVQPGDHVAVRWKGKVLVAVIELIPRPFTPTVIVDGKAHSDDVVDTLLLEQLLSVHCPDLEADVVSAGYRVAKVAAADVVSLYERVIGSDPAPAHRRTWIIVRADPRRARKSGGRRDAGVAGLVRYLVASTTRIADELSRHGVDAVCGRSFDDFDRAIDIGFEREKWSTIKGRNSFTTAYTVPGGPDVWWSAPADHTITRVRVAPGAAPESTVLLTTPDKPKKRRGFSRVSGGQRAALQAQILVSDRHHQLPIGSAGVLVGETASHYPVYLPFDDVDASVNLGDARVFTQFVLRAAAAGGTVTLGAHFREFAELVGAHIGSEAKVAWPNATSYLGPHPGVERVVLRHNVVGTPRHRQLPIRPVSPPEESRYEQALPRAGKTAS